MLRNHTSQALAKWRRMPRLEAHLAFDFSLACLPPLTSEGSLKHRKTPQSLNLLLRHERDSEWIWSLNPYQSQESCNISKADMNRYHALHQDKQHLRWLQDIRHCLPFSCLLAFASQCGQTYANMSKPSTHVLFWGYGDRGGKTIRIGKR